MSKYNAMETMVLLHALDAEIVSLLEIVNDELESDEDIEHYGKQLEVAKKLREELRS